MSDLERFDESWLSLREPADASARSIALVQRLQAYLDRAHSAGDAIELLDLGSGTGSTTRWLAPRLRGPQRWLLLDHDADLLAVAVARCATLADAAGDPVRVRTRTADLSDLSAADLRRATVVTASALLDILTGSQVADLAARCAVAGVAALLTLSVAGRVSLDPYDELDSAIAAAFDAHQRRSAGEEPFLGPDAVPLAGAAFDAHGFDVRVADSPWRLGPGLEALTKSWLDGWLAAASEQEAGLAAQLPAYRARRWAQLRASELSVVVQHRDLLALPR